MTDEVERPVDAGIRKGFIPSLNYRLSHIQDAVNSLRKAPVLALLIGGVLFSITFLIEKVASEVYDRFRPSEVEVLTASLVESSVEIESRLNDVLTLMKEVSEGADIDPVVLQQRIDDLLNGIDGIRPVLSEVALLRRDFALASAQQKSRDIELAGFSLEADVILRMNDGVTICPERFNVGISHSGNPNTEAPRVGLTSPAGENTFSSGMVGGQSISVDGATLVFVRSEIVGGERIYGFSFSCPS